MKKLFIFILASLFCVGLFAAGPKIPKIKSEQIDYIDLSDYLTYLNDSCTNLYSIVAFIDDNKYTLGFYNKSCNNDIIIAIGINFKNEKTLDNYISLLDTYDLEKEFYKIRQIFIKNEIKPQTFYTEDNSNISMLLYETDFFPGLYQ